MKHITAIILSAGLSSRMKRFKLALPFKKHTIIEEVIFQLSKTSIKETIVVTGFKNELIEDLLSSNDSIKIVHNPNYAKGMTTSIQCGIRAASKKSIGYLICLGDLPFIQSEEYDEILSVIGSANEKKPFIIHPFFKDIPANPVFFSAHFKDELLDLKQMEGAKSIIKSNSDKVTKLMLKTDHITADIDTPMDYKKSQM